MITIESCFVKDVVLDGPEECNNDSSPRHMIVVSCGKWKGESYSVEHLPTREVRTRLINKAFDDLIVGMQRDLETLSHYLAS